MIIKENENNGLIPFTVYLIPIINIFIDYKNNIPNFGENKIIENIGLVLIIILIRIYKKNNSVKNNYYKFLLYIGITNIIMSIAIPKLEIIVPELRLIEFFINKYLIMVILILLVESQIHRIVCKSKNITKDKTNIEVNKITSVIKQGITCGIIIYILSNIEILRLIYVMIEYNL